jgi:signal transduction histidine kinase
VTFAAAHDLKNDIATMLNWTDALDGSAAQNTDVLEACDAIRRAALNAGRKLRRLQTTLGAPVFEIVSLASLLLRFESSPDLSTASGILFTATLPSSDALVKVDPDQIQLLFEVLFDYSREAIEVHGPDGAIDLVAELTAQEVLLSWRDNGRGISEQFRDRAFSPFFESKVSNASLGLVVAKRIVTEHGGRIDASPRREGGACFRIAIPRVASAREWS